MDDTASGGEPDGTELEEGSVDPNVENVIPPKVNIETFHEVIERIPDSDIALENGPDGGQNGPATTAGAGDELPKRTGKTTKNYAATECGAKIEKHSVDVTVSLLHITYIYINIPPISIFFLFFFVCRFYTKFNMKTKKK